jgi:hypothetical protein
MKQSLLTDEEYMMGFELLVLKCNTIEYEEQIIVQYLGGLREEIYNVI